MSEVANTEKLIKLVRERSVLYDLSDGDYKNRDKKAEAWLQVATAMGFGEAKIWINKWKSLKDNYSKYKKSHDPSTGQAYKKYKAWPWAKRMRFLDGFNDKKGSNCHPSQTINDITSPTDKDNPSVDETQNTTHSEIPEYEGASKQRKKRIRTSIDDTSDFDKIINYLKNKNEQRSKMDAVDLLFASYAQTFKTFSIRRQCMLKMELATLFARYEVEERRDAMTQPSNRRSFSSTSNYSESVPSPAYSLADPSPIFEPLVCVGTPERSTVTERGSQTEL